MSDELTIAASIGGIISGLAGLFGAIIALKSIRTQKQAVDITQKQLKATIINDIRDNFSDASFRSHYKFLAKWVREARNADQQWYKNINLKKQDDIDLARDVTSKYFTKIGIHFRNGILEEETIRTIVSRAQAEFLICMLHPIQTRLPDYDSKSPYTYAIKAVQAAWPDEVKRWIETNPLLYDLYFE